VTWHAVSQIFTVLLSGTLAHLLVRQCRKPARWPGRMVLQSMNARHSSVTDWGLSHLPVQATFSILDVGCGGGRTLQKLAAMAPAGIVHGVDYSPTSVEVARGLNAPLIAAGRVQIQQASVSQLPFAAETFDAVTAVETHYYWPNLADDLREIRRVLKPGGQLIIIAETYRDSTFGALAAPVMGLLRARYLTLEQHREVFAAAGYSEIEVFSQPKKGWMCIVGRKAGA
jgi:SAM-dependent methyltransferase